MPTGTDFLVVLLGTAGFSAAGGAFVMLLFVASRQCGGGMLTRENLDRIAREAKLMEQEAVASQNYMAVRLAFWVDLLIKDLYGNAPPAERGESA